MPRLRKCPFCGKSAENTLTCLAYNELMGKWVLQHYCDNTMNVFITAGTEQEAIDKWYGVQHGKEHPAD